VFNFLNLDPNLNRLKMNTQEVADRLIGFCRERKNLEAVNELYSKDIISKEMPWVPNMEPVLTGKETVRKKNSNWFDQIKKMNDTGISYSIVAGNHFTTKLFFDATRKNGSEYYIEELRVYEVRNGKINAEQFFYS
jgi:hypothetical protein